MSDDKTIRGPADGSRVNVNEDYELRYWTEKFGVSAEQLRTAVQQVGPVAATVQAHLQKS